MTSIFTRKLELFAPLSDSDRKLTESVGRNPRFFDAGTVLIHEGDNPEHVWLVMEGAAFRSKTLEDGSRTIFAFLLPGDLCDSHVFILDTMDHTITALSDCAVASVTRAQMIEMMDRPAIARAIWFATLIDEATLREWLVNVGRRNAEERAAHLLCELHLRLASLGLTSDGEFEFPITQAELADTFGISAVHANRVLQSLRRANLVDIKSGSVKIPDVRKLREFCKFNPNYLHLERRSATSSIERTHLGR